MVAKGVAAKLLFSARSMAEARRDFVCVKMDLKNAFNAVARRAIIESLQAEPSLKHIWLGRLLWCWLHVTGLESLGEKCWACEEGAKVIP